MPFALLVGRRGRAEGVIFLHMRAPGLLMILLAVAQPFSLAGAADATDERAAAYREFREAFDQGDYKAALPIADRVVEMTRSQFEEGAPEVASALTNLATTYYRMKAYGEALDNYREAIDVLELLGNPGDTRLVRPLHGMGSALVALRRPEDAIVALKRAVDIIRARSGLHAEEQIPPLKTLIAAYKAADLLAEASREHDYAFSVAEQAYGKNDQRMLGPIGELAQWYEHLGRYADARSLHVRAVQIADSVDANSLEAIPGLRGIARCIRLDFTYNNGEASDSFAVSAVDDPRYSQTTRSSGAPNPEGERALRIALSRLGEEPEQAALRGEVLIDLGDWYLTARKKSLALEQWASAWKDLATAGDTSKLDRPTAVIYLAPPFAVSQRQRDPEEHSEQLVRIRLAIDETGAVREATVANPAPERESAEKAIQAALYRSAWRPAFRDGEAVAVNDFVFQERIYVKLPRPAE